MLTVDQLKVMKEIEESIDAVWSQLTRWEKTFVEDLLLRYAEDKELMFLSENQWLRLKEIYDDYLN